MLSTFISCTPLTTTTGNDDNFQLLAQESKDQDYVAYRYQMGVRQNLFVISKHIFIPVFFTDSSLNITNLVVQRQIMQQVPNTNLIKVTM